MLWHAPLNSFESGRKKLQQQIAILEEADCKACRAVGLSDDS